MKATRIERVRFMVCVDKDGCEFLGVTMAEGKGALEHPPNFVRWVGDSYEVELQNGLATTLSAAVH